MHPIPPPAWMHAAAPVAIPLDRVRQAMASMPASGLRAPPEVPIEKMAGVLVLVYEDGGDSWLVMTRRPAWMRRNAGDVAFPGGRQDPGEDIVTTALREAQEEIGLDPAAVEVVGELRRALTIGGIVMVPVVGLLSAPPTNLVASPDEVDAVLVVRLGDLLVADHYRGERWSADGLPREMHEFDLEGDTIWGATARILHDFLALVAGS